MESPPRKLPPKKDVLDKFLGNGSARVFLDPRKAGVIVPKWFAKQAELVLRVGYTLNPPIPDLLVTDEAVSCTLSFNRSPFWCKMPWHAVFAVVSDVDGRGVVWPEDVPLESQLLKPARPKPKLASVKDDATPAEKAPEEKEAAETEAEASAPEGAAEAPEKPAASAPAAAAEGTSGEKPAPSEAPAATSGAEPAASSTEGDKDDATSKKTKRQLPPYLRVVK